MDEQRVEGGWLLRFHRGEEIVSGLLAFARDRGLQGGWVQGLGAVEDAELGYYDLDTKEYLRQTFPGDWEIAALVGNLGWANDEPAAHLHAVLGSRDFTARGGHLFRGRVGATCEIFVRDLGSRLERGPDSETGLNLWRLRGGTAAPDR